MPLLTALSPVVSCHIQSQMQTFVYGLQPSRDLSRHFWPPALVAFSSRSAPRPPGHVVFAGTPAPPASGSWRLLTLRLDTLFQLSSGSLLHFIQIPSCLQSPLLCTVALPPTQRCLIFPHSPPAITSHIYSFVSGLACALRVQLHKGRDCPGRCCFPSTWHRAQHIVGPQGKLRGPPGRQEAQGEITWWVAKLVLEPGPLNPLSFPESLCPACPLKAPVLYSAFPSPSFQPHLPP